MEVYSNGTLDRHKLSHLVRDPTAVAVKLAKLKAELPYLDMPKFLERLPNILFEVSHPSPFTLPLKISHSKTLLFLLKFTALLIAWILWQNLRPRAKHICDRFWCWNQNWL